MIKKLSTVFKSHPWLSGFLFFSAFFIATLPIIAQQAAIYLIAKETGQKVKIENVDINLFSGQFAIDNFQMQSDNSSAEIKHFSFDLILSKLFQKRLQFSTITLDGAQLPIEIVNKDGKNHFKIAGLSLPQSDSSEPSDTQQPWIDFGVDQLQINDFRVQLQQEDKQQLYQVNSLKLQELYSWDTDFAQLKLNSDFNHRAIDANLQLHLFSDVPKLVGTLKVRDLHLKDLQELLQTPLDGTLNGETTFTLEQLPNGLALYQFSDLALSEPKIAVTTQQYQAKTLHWQGDVHYFLGELQGLKVDGKLQAEQFVYEDKNKSQIMQAQASLNADIHLFGHLNGKDAKLDQFGLIKLTQPQFNQQQKNDKTQSALSLTQSDLSYNGSIEWLLEQETLNLDGKLQAKETQIKQTLSQADKTQQTDVKLQSLMVGGEHHINLKEAITAQTFAKVALDKLSLEMSEQNALGEKQSLLSLQNDLSGTLNLQTSVKNETVDIKQKGPITVSNIAFSQLENRFNSKQIAWEGSINWQQKRENQQLKLQGKLDGKNLAVKTPDLQLKNSLQAQLDLAMQQNPKTLKLTQNGALKIQNVEFKQADIQHQNALIDYQGLIDFEQQFPTGEETEDGKQRVELNGALNLQQGQTRISMPEGETLELSENANSQFKLKGEFSSETLALDYQGKGAIEQLKLLQNKQLSQVKQLTWDGGSKFSQYQKDKESQQDLAGTLSVSARQLSFGSSELDTPAVKLQSLQLPEIKLSGSEQIQLKNLRLKNLQLQGTQNSKPQPVTQIGEIKLDQIALQTGQQTSAAIGNISVLNSATQITLDKDKKIQQVVALQQALGLATQPEAEKTTSVDNAGSAFFYSLQSLQLDGRNQIHIEIEDQQKEPIKKDIQLEKLLFSNLNSQQPTQMSNYQLLAKIDEFSEIKSEGKVAPLNPQFALDANTTINGLSLNDFSPLLEEAVGYQIDSGQLSAKISSLIQQNKLKIDNDIKLYKFQISSANKDKSAEFDKNFSVPLEVGVNLLQDKEGNIKLKLPIDGDLDNPNFSLEGVISRALNGALGKATRTYLLLALQPFGAIALVGELAFDQLSAVQLQAINFPDASFKLSNDMELYLQKVSGLLKSKSDVQIKLCGGVNQSDKQSIAKMAQTESQRENNQLPDVSDDQLLRLATMRQNMIKRYLLKQGVKTDQIVICKPKIGKDTGAAKVQMGI